MDDDAKASLEYYARRQRPADWGPFVVAVVAVLSERAGPEQAADLLRGVGARMARSAPLGSASTLEVLEESVNAALTDAGWGWARLSVLDRHVEIAHGASPEEGLRSPDPVPWFVPLLEGLYTEWLNTAGGVAGYRATCISAPPFTDEPILLRYGRAD